MVAIRRSIALGGLAALGAICTAVPAAGSTRATPAETGITGLRAAAVAWAHAVLTGSVADIRSLVGVQCHSGPTYGPKVLDAYLKGMRAGLRHSLGTPLRSIRITGVKTRNVTATTGEAEVTYALPAAVVGNDDWVTYGYQHGGWKVTNCQYPIGYESVSASSSATSGR